MRRHDQRGGVEEAEEGNSLERTQKLVNKDRLLNAGIDREVKMQDDQETNEGTEQEGERCDLIAQELRKEQEEEHGGFEFDGKDNQGSDVAKHLPSTEERAQIADFLHPQGKKLLHSSSSWYPVFKQEGESTFPGMRNPLTIPQQSKVASDSSSVEFPYVNLSLQLPHCLAAGRLAELDTNQKRSSDSVVNGKHRSHSQEIFSRFFRPLPANFRAGFGQCRELKDRRRHEKISTGLHLSPEGHDNSKHADAELGISHHEEDEYARGFAAKTLSPTLRIFNDPLQDIPESSSLASSQETCALPIHSGVQLSHMHCPVQEREDTPLSVAPPSISCVDSFECDNFGVQNTTGISANESNLRNDFFRHRSEEIVAMKQAGGLVTCKDLEMLLTQGSDTAEGPIKVKSEGFDALDLLVSAIQVASAGIHGMEDGAPGPSGMIEGVSEGVDGFHSGSEEVCFSHGSSAIMKKRVIRRARSAFKQQCGGNSLQNARTFNIPEGLPFGRKRKRHSDNKPAGIDTENDITSRGSELAQVKHGGPVIRSMRGRSQVLPIKFCDSVLQPWKRRSRKERKGMFALT